MIARTQLTRPLLAAVGALALSAPASAAAAEAPSGTPGATGQGGQPGETSYSGASSPDQSTVAPTLTVEPAPTPPPSAPTRQAAGAPRLHLQHAQGGTRGQQGGQANPRGGRSKAKTPGARANGPHAPSPSALTPPLPLAFSASLSGVPAFFIESFRIPPFLLPIFQAAGTAYGVPWQVLAAINEVETDYGRDLSVSSAGAEGWMQFLPSSWSTYGVDANGDGFKDPYNPADAIFAAARYLRAAGAATNLRAAIFAYNHSRAYVESVLLRARLLGGTPSELLGALAGLTEARFPVHAPSHFSDGFAAAPAGSGHGTLAGTTIYSEAGAPVIAVQDGQISRIGDSRELGHFIVLRDAYGNTYTYAQLGRVARFYPVLQPHEEQASGPEAKSAEAREPTPSAPATAGVQPRAQTSLDKAPVSLDLAPAGAAGLGGGAALAGSLAGAPTAPAAGAAAPTPAVSTATTPATTPAAPSAPRPFRAGPNDVYLHRLRVGVRVIAGTVLGHLGAGAGQVSGVVAEAGPRMLFQIRPAGRGAPLIDPKPILDGWVQLENTSVYRASEANPFSAAQPSPGQVLLESKRQLEQQVLSNRGIHVQRCGRQDIQTAQVDRRVLATLEFLAVSGLRPTVSGLPCARPGAGAEAGPSAQASGEAVEISAINGLPIAGHGRPGSITDTTMRKLLTLQGPMAPRQIIAPIRVPRAASTLAIAPHRNRIRVSFAQPPAAAGHIAGAFGAAISPTQWIELIARLGEIPNPVVRSGPSAASIPDHPAPPGASAGVAGGNG
jgi:hypothetical protein